MGCLSLSVMSHEARTTRCCKTMSYFSVFCLGHSSICHCTLLSLSTPQSIKCQNYDNSHSPVSPQFPGKMIQFAFYCCKLFCVFLKLTVHCVAARKLKMFHLNFHCYFDNVYNM